jgi:hypothetical protein
MYRYATFDGFSTITFDDLAIRVHVSRKCRTAGVFSLISVDTPNVLHGECLGALLRHPAGHLDWRSCEDTPCPVEVIHVVATMI